MNWIFTLFVIWLMGGVAMMTLRFLRERRGRRVCTQWLCPQCHQQFGGTFRKWRRRQGVIMKSALFAGPVLHCSHCRQDFWFTWTGRRLPEDRMTDTFEIAEKIVV